MNNFSQNSWCPTCISTGHFPNMSKSVTTVPSSIDRYQRLEEPASSIFKVEEIEKMKASGSYETLIQKYLTSSPRRE
jgi:hypothetical protein